MLRVFFFSFHSWCEVVTTVCISTARDYKYYVKIKKKKNDHDEEFKINKIFFNEQMNIQLEFFFFFFFYFLFFFFSIFFIKCRLCRFYSTCTLCLFFSSCVCVFVCGSWYSTTTQMNSFNDVVFFLSHFFFQWDSKKHDWH